MTSDIHIKELSDDDSCLVLEATFAAMSPLLLFDHFVETDLLARWWAPQSVSERRVGGRFHLSWPDMKWDLRGTYAEYVPGKRLVFSWAWDHEPGRPMRTVEIDFRVDRHGKGSSLTLSHSRYDASDEDQADRLSHLEGWRFFLGQLNELQV